VLRAQYPCEKTTEANIKTLLALENAALVRWCAGDPSGFLEICSDDVVYFDPFLEQRLDGIVALTHMSKRPPAWPC